jgi:hypothetical protein
MTRAVKENLFKPTWKELDVGEIMILLYEVIGPLGQYRDYAKNPNTFYLPLADESCQIVLKFCGQEIKTIEKGPAFDLVKWERVQQEIDEFTQGVATKVGREVSFNPHRVTGSWRGERSGVQILPPPDGAPRADVEDADHPFILEFPVRNSELWPVMRHRWMREHRKLTLLLNILLVGRTSFQPRQHKGFWAAVWRDGSGPAEFIWAKESFFAPIGKVVIDELSSPAAEKLQIVQAEEYYSYIGHDGSALRVPNDLDESICRYVALSSTNREKFDRAIFWTDIASRTWNFSASASFAALVSALEALTERGKFHAFECPICCEPTQHEKPGATKTFRGLIETYAPGRAMGKQREEMYELRSGILHGRKLISIDQDLTFGSNPPLWNERNLHDELWGLTRILLRNWLKQPPAG